MKSPKLAWIAAGLFVVLANPGPLAAQHTRYKLIDLETFGGPSGYLATSNR